MCKTCGNPHTLCHDPDQVWYPQRAVDYAVMEQKAADARYERLHENLPYHDGTFTNWAKDRSADHPYKYDEGVTVLVTPVDYTPDDLFLTDPRAPAFPRGGEDDGGSS